jgi:DNA-binding NarL/FixJ family response regulator
MMGKQQNIRLIIADDHALVRAGLAAYLKPSDHIHLMGEAENGDDAVQLCAMVNPDVAILDAHMPGLDGLTAAQIIRQRWPHIAVLMLLTEKDPDLVHACLEAGAAGCLSKNITPQELYSAIQNAHNKTAPVPPQTGEPASAVRGSSKSKKSDSATKSIVSSQPQHSVITELEMAGKIQSKILPEKPPVLEGWDISATLEPAFETSGDFYDFIPLAYGKIGIVIADVANKGLGAAIFMALCSSLIRTYATHFPIMPAMMLNAVNERLNADTRSGMFVTAFYAVLDPKLNRLIYVNAGHNPPILISSNKGKPLDLLGPTGPALGIFERTSWQQKMVKFSPHDVLLMYTDGITEARNAQDDYFGDQRLLSVLRNKKDRTAREIQQAVLSAVKRFEGGARREDDIALIVINRNA